MAPTSSGTVSIASVFLLLSSCSRRSLSYLLDFWLLVRIPDSRSMERASPGDSRFCPQSLEASRSKSVSSRCRRMKDLTLKLNLWRFNELGRAALVEASPLPDPVVHSVVGPHQASPIKLNPDKCSWSNKTIS
ncbi:hypothetical protein V6N11_007155 [Hibiscus sabdariffa]|uniref:Secreted protein n=1 Tax=Hibiscus sabdariffa TaxID=183260 RepID=A0ABR2RTN5_9ROSI